MEMNEAQSRAPSNRIQTRSNRLHILPMDHDFTTVDEPRMIWDLQSVHPRSPGVDEPLAAHRRTWIGA